MNVWVVGGTSGIGKAIADYLIIGGHYVYATGREVDVRSVEALEDAAAEPPAINTVVYSAGVNRLEWSDKVRPVEAVDLYDVNVVGLLRVLKAVPAARRVVVVGSDAAWRPMRTSVAYCASKAALHMAVQVIARERASEDFRINVVAPGKVEVTAMTEYVDRRSAELRPEMDHIAYQKSQIPNGRFCTPEEVAEVVYDVLLTRTPYLNGAVIPINGGRY